MKPMLVIMRPPAATSLVACAACFLTRFGSFAQKLTNTARVSLSGANGVTSAHLCTYLRCLGYRIQIQLKFKIPAKQDISYKINVSTNSVYPCYL
jgi:hypothetical protein